MECELETSPAVNVDVVSEAVAHVKVRWITILSPLFFSFLFFFLEPLVQFLEKSCFSVPLLITAVFSVVFYLMRDI